MDASPAATDEIDDDEDAERFSPGEEMLPGLLARPRSATEVPRLLEAILPAGEAGLWPEWASTRVPAWSRPQQARA